MAITEQKQGEDIKINFAFTDSNGDAINIDNLSEIYCFIIHKKTGTVLARFSKAGSGEYTALVKDTTTSYHGWIDSSITKTAKTGHYRADCNLVETESELTDNIQNSIVIDTIINLVKSDSKTY